MFNKKVFISFSIDSGYCQLAAAYREEETNKFKVIAFSSYTIQGFRGSDVINYDLAYNSIKHVYFKFTDSLIHANIDIEGITLTIPHFLDLDDEKNKAVLTKIFKDLAEETGTYINEKNFWIFDRGTSAANYLTPQTQGSKDGLLIFLDGTVTSICYYDCVAEKCFTSSIKIGYSSLVQALHQNYNYPHDSIWQFLKKSSAVVIQGSKGMRINHKQHTVMDVEFSYYVTTFLQGLFQLVKNEIVKIEKVHQIKIGIPNEIILTGVGTHINSIERCAKLVLSCSQPAKIESIDEIRLNNRGCKYFEYYLRDEDYKLPVKIVDFDVDIDPNYSRAIVNNDILIKQGLSANFGALQTALVEYEKEMVGKKGLKGWINRWFAFFKF